MIYSKKNRFGTHGRLLILLFCGLFVIGCGARHSLTVTRPAEVNLKNFDKIAVGEIKGSPRSGIAKFSTELMTALFQSERFEVLDNQALTMSLGQNNLAMNSLTDGSNSEEISKIFGNLALIYGTILDYGYGEDLTYKDEEKKDKETGEVTKTRVYTRSGEATVGISLRIVDLRTSKMLANRTFEKSYRSSNRREKASPPPINREKLFEKCRAQIIRSFLRTIAPYTERVYVSFETAKEIPELEHGFSMVKADNWAGAIEIFEKVVETQASSPLVYKAYYNLGLSYMYTDQFDKAKTALESAYSGKPERKYQDAINKLNVRIVDTRRLEEQRPVDPDAEERK